MFRDAARARSGRLDFLMNAHPTDRDYLVDRFSIAEAYLCAVLNWTVRRRSISRPGGPSTTIFAGWRETVWGAGLEADAGSEGITVSMIELREDSVARDASAWPGVLLWGDARRLIRRTVVPM
jgi:hypothetical protein